MNQSTTWVYLAKDFFHNFCKIGFTQNVMRRDRQIKTHAPFTDIFFAFHGTKQEEQRLHADFQAKRIRGEWFALDSADIIAIQQAFLDRQKFFVNGEPIKGAH